MPLQEADLATDNIPDLTGRVVIVTGANTGVGKEVAKILLNQNAKVYIAARSQERTQDAIRDLQEQTAREAIFLKLDLCDLRSVKAAAEEFMTKEKELHILFNNAGVIAPPLEALTSQGYDLQFGTNVLGHFYFTSLLLPALRAGKVSSPDGKVRVINTTSSAAFFAKGIQFSALNNGPERIKFSIYQLYYFSRLGNIIFAKELARRYGSEGIISTSCNPGVLKSDLRPLLGFFENLLESETVLHTPLEGALILLWVGTSAETLNVNGQYLTPWAHRTTNPPPGYQDEKLAADLWVWCERQCARAF